MKPITDQLKIAVTDIRFWIFIFFLIRLYGITNPPLEVAHNWRQTTVTMVARNFYEVDANVFYPRIDFAGEKTGITGMEFPFFNYLIYLVSLLFGYQHWYGRLINLIVSSFGIMYFFKLAEKYFSPKIAFNAAFILLVSLWFCYSRKIMPDTFSMSLLFIGMFYGSNYLDRGNKTRDLLFYFIFCLVATLSKISSAYILVVFAPLILDSKIAVKPKIIFLFSSLIYLSVVSSWYFYWVPFLVKEYGFWHFFMGKSFAEGANDIWNNLNNALSRFYDTSLKYTGFAAFVAGLFLMFKRGERRLAYTFLFAFPAFLILVFKEGFNFSHHTYYVIPFVPVMALVAGYAVSAITNKKIAFIVLLAIAVEGILNQQHDFRIKDKDEKLLQLESDLDKFSKRNDLVIFNCGQYPTPMYFAHRKGWVDTNEKISDPSYINDLKTKGLKYIIILKQTFGTEIKINYNMVLDNESYAIYKL
ncbi:MAG: glycosyltransferase family 39 protein [Bacteroidia bacterium]